MIQKNWRMRQFPTMVWLIMALCWFTSCKEEVDTSARYVFKLDTAVSYMQKHPDAYSEYVNLLYQVPISKVSQTMVGQLLTARGHYTVFAPTNEAIQNYLNLLAERKIIEAPSWDAFPDSVVLDSIRKVIVYNSIIDSGDDSSPYYTSDFPSQDGAELTDPTLNDHKIAIYWDKNDPDALYVNKDCPVNVKNRDIQLMNGVIHRMERVIAPDDITADLYFSRVLNAKKDGYLAYAKAIHACGLMDTLAAYRDNTYDMLYERGLIPTLNCDMVGLNYGGMAYPPRHRKYGYTIFAETDDYWRSQGLDPQSDNFLADLQQWILDNHQYSSDDVFTTGTDYQSESNLLYQWLTYHILPMRLVSNKLVFHHNEIGYNLWTKSSLGNPVTEYYATFGKKRLFKLYESKLSDGVRINRFPLFDDGRHGTGDENGCEPGKEGVRVNRDSTLAELSSVINCCIYPLDEPIAYTDEVRRYMKQERVRFDFMALFPENMTNDIRKKDLTHSNMDHSQFTYIPPRSVYPYLNDLYINDGSHFRYTNFYGVGATHLYADEVLCTGHYEVTIPMHPVPLAGVYELRFGYWADNSRGIAQLYFGDDLDHMKPTGIPVDFNITGEDKESGWSNDTEDDDYNAELDKAMRNNGFMKEAKSIVPMGNLNDNARDCFRSLRRILVREYLEPNKTYYLRVKNVMDIETKCFMFDYFEWCAKEIYDNPSKPEDIW